MKEAVTKIIEDFENEQLSVDEAIEKIKAATGRDTDRYSLENYWRSVDIEDFVSQFTEPDIKNWERMKDEDTLKLIAEVRTGSCSSGRMDRVFEAFNKRYRRSDSFTIVWMEDFTDEEALEELKKDTVIRL